MADSLCERVAAALPTAVEDLEGRGTTCGPSTPGEVPGLVDPGWAIHLSSCLRCQAELARYRTLRRLLHEIPAGVFQVAGQFHQADPACDGGDARPRATLGGSFRSRRLVMVGSLTLAALAGAATASAAVGRTCRRAG